MDPHPFVHHAQPRARQPAPAILGASWRRQAAVTAKNGKPEPGRHGWADWLRLVDAVRRLARTVALAAVCDRLLLLDACLDLVERVGFQPVGLAVDAGCRLPVRRVDEAEDLTVGFVDPVLRIVHAVLVLDPHIGFVGLGARPSRWEYRAYPYS
jgi:hypothetical protein